MDRRLSRSSSLDCRTADLAAHVRTVAGRYHAFLDRALRGERRQLVPMADIGRVNAEEMAAVPPATATAGDHIAEFARLARSYADRVRDGWDTPIGSMDGYMPAGIALGVQALEFNVHAWDFARTVDEDYRPRGDQVIFDVAARAFVLSKARFGQRAVGVLQASVHPVVRQMSGDPWRAILKRLGRLG